MVSKFIAKYPVPEDFPDLLHDFAREVLRDQPENIYEYGAQYFKALYTVSKDSYLKPQSQIKMQALHRINAQKYASNPSDGLKHKKSGCL